MHGEPPFAIEGGAWRRIRGLIAALPLNGQALTFFGRHELDNYVIRDYTNDEPVDLRNLRAERLGLRGARTSDQRSDQRRHKTCAASAEQSASRYRRRMTITGAKQHALPPLEGLRKKSKSQMN